MSETFVCNCCKVEFTVECPDGDADCIAQLNAYRETYPVCAGCQHAYLAWCGAHAAM